MRKTARVTSSRLFFSKKHNRPRPPPRKSLKPIPAPDRVPPVSSAPPGRPPPPTPPAKTAAADSKTEVWREEEESETML